MDLHRPGTGGEQDADGRGRHPHVTYGYNAAGQLTTLTTPSGQQIGYSYLNNRVAGITVNGAALIRSDRRHAVRAGRRLALGQRA